jgi:type III restriction enzyme
VKLKFKQQGFQTAAVKSVADCFGGQPKGSALRYAIDPGRIAAETTATLIGLEKEGFANDKVVLQEPQLLENIQRVQREQNLTISSKLEKTSVCDISLDIEMETGTGKTYCYIKTMFELNRAYGWSKFIVVVPSIAIREGVLKSFEIMADHFLESYGRRRVTLFIIQSSFTISKASPPTPGLT